MKKVQLIVACQNCESDSEAADIIKKFEAGTAVCLIAHLYEIIRTTAAKRLNETNRLQKQIDELHL